VKRKLVLSDAEWQAKWRAQHSTWLSAPPVQCSPGQPMGSAFVAMWIKIIIEASGRRATGKAITLSDDIHPIGRGDPDA
jgi:hypothetical protein